MWRCHSRSLGTKFQTKIVKFEVYSPLRPTQALPHPMAIQIELLKNFLDYPFNSCTLGASFTSFLKFIPKNICSETSHIGMI